MRFFECLTGGDVIRLSCNGERAFYGVKSIGARIAIRVLARLGRAPNVDKLSFGDLERVIGIRESAYRGAEAAIDDERLDDWTSAVSTALGIDFALIFQKYRFDERYEALEFVEMAERYAGEHPEEPHELVVTSATRHFAEHCKSAFNRFRVRRAGVPGAFTVLLLPLFVEVYWRQQGRSDDLRIDDSIVCEVDSERVFEMFSSLFADTAQNLVFVCEARNAIALSAHPEVEVLGLRRDGVRFLRGAVWLYLRETARAWGAVSSLGGHLFRVFYLVMRGRAAAIDGSGNTYCTYEHLVPLKTARNAFLRITGSRTVFVPLNAHVTPQYFQSELAIDYDVMCCAGPHIERLYHRKRSRIGAFLPTGSYDSHRMRIPSPGRGRRVERLRDIKGDRTAVLLISCGICDPTRRHEVKLMDLARRLATMPEVKVFVRLKPVEPEPKYTDFYRDALDGHDEITVTAGEYDLFDFVEVADLAVTSISNAAFDLAQAGVQTMFVDFLGEPALHLCLAETQELPIPAVLALQRVADWVADTDGAREAWSVVMRRFVDDISYLFSDFASYRANLLSRLQVADIPVKPTHGLNQVERLESIDG